MKWVHEIAMKWDDTFASNCPICRTARAWVEIGMITLLIIDIALRLI